MSNCKFCNSENIIKYGTYGGVQLYFCKDCGSKFKDDDTTFHMKTPTNQVTSALNMWYEGMSIKGIAWFQGRLTESLLGIRMPRKRRKHRATGTRWQRLKINLKNPRLYSSMLCLFLMYPLGIIYFTVIITFMAVSLGLISTPILYLLSFNVSVPVLPAPLWFHCLTMILGLVMATWSLHLVNIMARLHGRMTKKLLLRK